MSTKAGRLIDIVASKVLYIPVNTPEGLKRLDMSVRKDLRRKTIEDDISVVRGLDLSEIRRASKEGVPFEYENLFAEAMPKVDARGLHVRRVNSMLTKALDERGILFDAQEGRKAGDRYEMPVTKYEKDRGRICYLVYKESCGKLHYPSLGSYHSPFVSFNCYVNSGFGNDVVRIVHDTIAEMTRKKTA